MHSSETRSHYESFWQTQETPSTKFDVIAEEGAVEYDQDHEELCQQINSRRYGNYQNPLMNSRRVVSVSPVRDC
jgi:hypothetical protein